jgi:hypothetical protein
MRWARSLLASGVSPSEIAIATASPADYDDHFLALRADANIDLHFVHGVRTVTTREGQAAAALADIVVRGLSQSRLRRLAALCRDSGPFETLPEGWLRVLPTDAPLDAGAWNRLLAGWRRKTGPMAPTMFRRCARRSRCWQRTGRRQRDRRSLPQGPRAAIWRKALLAGPAASIDATLETLKQDDGLEACVCVAWMPASALAASPRRFVRLLGLNSSRWPRGIAEDRLIPDHIIPTPVLDPLPVNLADRRDFETILATTADTVVLSRARRDSDGRLWDAAPARRTWRRNLSAPQRDAGARLQRDRPPHGPAPGVRRRSTSGGAQGCWRDWRQAEITPMTGWCGRIIRSFSPSSAAPSRPARCAACCAIRSASCGSMRSGGANRRAAPNRSCSTRSGSAILSTWFSTAPCAISKPQAALPPPTLNHRSSGGAGGASRRRRLGERAPGSAGRHLGAHPRRCPRAGRPRPVLWR